MTQWLQKAYAMGDYKAYGAMGDVYYEGKGCMQNYSRAYTYYKVAEAHGDAHAKERVLDYSYLGLDGHEQNKKMAVDEYVKLGDMLSDDGNYKIGMYYYEEYEKNDNNIFESYAKNYFSKINPASAKVHWTQKQRTYSLSWQKRKLSTIRLSIIYFANLQELNLLPYTIN